MRCKNSTVIFIQKISIFFPSERGSYHHCIYATNKPTEWKTAWLVLHISVPHLKCPGASIQVEQSWTGALWSTLKNIHISSHGFDHAFLYSKCMLDFLVINFLNIPRMWTSDLLSLLQRKLYLENQNSWCIFYTTTPAAVMIFAEIF